MNRRRAAFAAALVLATAAAYARCFTAPFVFDDKPAIVDSNPTIRHLWPIWTTLSPPHANGQTVGGRPLPNLTLAINYAVSGVQPWSYHALNLLIHLAAALVLFGLIRRTLAFLRRGAPRPPEEDWIAFAAALLWALHPLQTEAVTYIVQRVESLMALCYLLTLYAFARRRFVLAFVCCLLGMACKEVMATAPLMVLLYDRTFVSGGWAEAWRRHRRLHLALASTWLLVLGLALGTQQRGGTAGFPLGGNWRSHVLTQIYALPHYLRLTFWPRRLVFDYGYFQVHDAWSVLPQAVLLAGLLGATVWGLARGRRWAFLGAWFFLVLAPSTVVPIPVQTMAEHRMYLPLAALAAGAALALGRLRALGPGGRLGANLVLGVLAAALGTATYARNLDYQSELRIWKSAALNHPAGNARACFNYANLLAGQGRRDEAIAQLERAVRIEPRFAAAYDNLGTLRLSAGQIDRALGDYDRAIELDPKLIDPLFHSAAVLEQLGRAGEAERRLGKVLELDPHRAEARLELGNAFFRAGRLDESLVQYRAAERDGALSARAENNIGTLLFERRDYAGAARYYRQALALGPDSSDTRVNLGNALALGGDLAGAAGQFQAALRLDPRDAQARENLAKLQAALGGP